MNCLKTDDSHPPSTETRYSGVSRNSIQALPLATIHLGGTYLLDSSYRLCASNPGTTSRNFSSEISCFGNLLCNYWADACAKASLDVFMKSRF
ncbi:Protein of unknown function [Pyronema omphalodes CBS 100304]|uniref:Uncharacterized protein n=1 Tax=Pyronema omphalodes (strain CBS 100304) TaxID=1076935 RepID=U4LV52_PYROM|nr:Protein of unknown function [Pyronema omphalodes CBS 100304]